MNPFALGDSADQSEQTRFKKLYERLEAVKDGKEFTTIVLDDPVGNSYIQVSLSSTCLPFD